MTIFVVIGPAFGPLTWSRLLYESTYKEGFGQMLTNRIASRGILMMSKILILTHEGGEIAGPASKLQTSNRINDTWSARATLPKSSRNPIR